MYIHYITKNGYLSWDEFDSHDEMLDWYNKNKYRFKVIFDFKEIVEGKHDCLINSECLETLNKIRSYTFEDFIREKNEIQDEYDSEFDSEDKYPF